MPADPAGRLWLWSKSALGPGADPGGARLGAQPPGGVRKEARPAHGTVGVRTRP